ncbi:MAG: MotA/TolQ/ExbB proton channel family protein [Deltaproteobacteria bacterium]|nr:MAG: MotA/TolQ/ExbB proton channel family protein [Deltaproteobacteria bacterium]
MIESIARAFVDGGIFMYAITAALGLGLAVMGERAYFLIVKFSVDGGKFFAELRKLLENGDIEGASKLCGGAPLPRILGAGVRAAKKGERAIQNAVDEEALAVIPLVEKRIHYLSMIANVSTLLGLLGTIIGLMQAFDAVAGADPSQKGAMLAKGISMAMNTTAYGLMVAIPNMVAYAFLQSKAGKIVDEIDEYSVKLINLFAALRKGE